ncbi:MAG: MerR family transcriptional regulator [Boseongicola sp.]
MLTIGAASRLSGVNVETIRYYEKRGLVNLPDRSASGRRLYTDNQIAELRFVRRCREIGFSLSDVEDILSSARSGEYECQEVMSIGRRHLKGVQEKIKKLKTLEADLSSLLDMCGDNETCSCPMLDVMLRDPLT